MTDTTVRAGYSDAPSATEALHILIIMVEDRPGAVDRVIGTLRRKRANLQSLSLSQEDVQNRVRITALVKDTNISSDNLAEQVRRIVDVQQVTKLAADEVVSRELVLVKVDVTAETIHGILVVADQFGANVAGGSSDTITFAISGDKEKIANGIAALQAYPIREIARSGCIAMAR